MTENTSEPETADLRAVSGALRYAYRVSDSVLLKLYALAFLAASAFLTVLFLLALVTWLGRLQGTPPVGNVWGFLPFLVVVYLAIEGVLFAPLYLPMRRYRSRRRAANEGAPAEDGDGDSDE